jgi:hypothetical protein
MRTAVRWIFLIAAAGVLPGASLMAQSSFISPEKLNRGFEQPFLEGAFGIGVDSKKDFGGAFAPTGILEGRLGYTDLLKKRGVLDLEERFILGGYSSSEYSPVSAEAGDVTNDMIRLGVGARNGFGWEIGFMKLIPFSGYSFDVSQSTFTPTAPISPADSAFIGRIAGAYRFGESFEGGVQLRIFQSLAINATAHGQIVFPRIVFPEWAGSYAIMAGSLIALSTFSEDIVNSSEVLGPVLYFVLRNGLAYAFFAAMKDKGNWPFPSEQPLAVESFRLSAMIAF